LDYVRDIYAQSSRLDGATCNGAAFLLERNPQEWELALQQEQARWFGSPARSRDRAEDMASERAVPLDLIRL
jgi:hypothetical protein